MEISKALVSGLAGAVVLTITHETLRRLVPEAPRMDVLGMRAISKIMKKAGAQPPADDTLRSWAMVGDVISNSLYYSLAGAGKDTWLRGSLLGAGAGAGAVLLPGPMGLGTDPSNRTNTTRAMTVGLYLLGGLVAAAVGSALACDDKDC
ncbi:hypothetical protein [Pontibacter amylolyticus]|uniref:DUF4126 domain-containing protein n=1 Tax=Pontibacter amylolyticus TaxID=1424080 RepID=A0ABQ1WLH6_9BACT|nr:hypothetical protein [Pontibacter amylolyticus]GGG31633.1 hypothetical protein GCM10011323_38730 [Pontibacter amylolyticus]